ncbi:unnamed protein product [Phytomonas sp. EM1]|nr:unnamed protein product [Phytomonas sp. EM1]|eukprot:CCW64630.1 unnamed protein product [Phytomonas sp. isolate EM1]
MQSPTETEEARKGSLNERLDRHMAWKREFFRTRSPPPAIGRIHRRQAGHKGGAPVHITFKRAREIAFQQTPSDDCAAAHDVPNSQEDSTEPLKMSRHKQWLAQMREERARRSPFTDLQIHSNAQKTVIMANLHPDTIEEDVRRFADQFGRVVQVRIVRHNRTGKSRRYAFVEYGLTGEARRATTYSKKKRLKGRSIIIDIERGRIEVGFLPKRLAEAARYEPSDADTKIYEKSTSQLTNASVLDSQRMMKSVESNECDDDDAFLNAILNN